MLYTGRFKNRNEETIQVNIITNNNTAQETELKFVDESPVVIVQNSSDGIFSPIKSRSCTITIVANEPYYDMYSGTSHGTKVTVNNLGTGECLFYGYLTPCEYNQPLLYLNEIELEAVDAASSLQDFKYELVNAPDSSIRTVASIVTYCLHDIAGYTGGIYVPEYGLKSYKAYLNNFYPMEIECISEEIFIDDEETLSCYEVLEEICNFYNLSLVPYGDDVYFIDYKVISNSSSDNENILWKDLVTNQVLQTLVTKTIEKDDYAGDDQNVELDEVYNKISIKADVKEIEEDDILYDPVDDAAKSKFYETVYESRLREGTGEEWEFYVGLYSFTKDPSNPSKSTTSNWQTLFNSNAVKNDQNYVLTDNFTTQYVTPYNWVNFPYTSGGNLNYDVNAQACLLSKYFGYKSSEEIPYKANWQNLLMFFPQVQWINEYYKYNTTSGIDVTGGNDNIYAWWRNFYENHLGGALPVLKYRGNKIINFSPANNYSYNNYLLFTGNILWQRNCNYDDVNYWIWNRSMQEDQHQYDGTWIPIKEHGAHDTDDAHLFRRNKNDNEYNTGWPMLKIKLKIGNKYWNGTTWTTTESTAWINYHRKNVKTEDETIIWSDFNKPVTNYDFNKGIDSEGYIIPIKLSDSLLGKISLDIYMPLIPWSDGLIYTSDGKNLIDYKKTPPIIFMENLSMKLISSSSSTIWDMLRDPAQADDDDDIIYSNTINSNNITEFDDLELKINTYNKKKPIGLSYVLDPAITNGQPDLSQLVYHTQGFYDEYKFSLRREELQIIDRYVQHYSKPHKIYNCEVHGYYEPWKCIMPKALDYLKMVVDEQEYDVKADANELKIIEY